jgi:XTP/dITP diphosphohydrolase
LQSAVNIWQSAIGGQQLTVGSQELAVNQQEKENRKKKVEGEFGDVVFSLINYARFLQIDAENALELTNKKFIHRFTQMEQQALQGGKGLSQMTLPEMDAIWNTIKQQQEK